VILSGGNLDRERLAAFLRRSVEAR
jgi:hypothetical protein